MVFIFSMPFMNSTRQFFLIIKWDLLIIGVVAEYIRITAI